MLKNPILVNVAKWLHNIFLVYCYFFFAVLIIDLFGSGYDIYERLHISYQYRTSLLHHVCIYMPFIMGLLVWDNKKLPKDLKKRLKVAFYQTFWFYS